MLFIKYRVELQDLDMSHLNMDFEHLLANGTNMRAKTLSRSISELKTWHTVLTMNPLDFGCSGENGQRVQEEIGFGQSAGDAGYQISLCLTVSL